MQFDVLGSVRARVNGGEVPLGGPKQRALLAMLLLHANEVVPRDRLIDGMWGAEPPATASHTLDNYVSRLRKALGDERLTRRPPGYLLTVADGELDVDRFDRLVEQGRNEFAAGQAAAAAQTLRSALGLWRGVALADVLYEPFASIESERLEERRLLALEERIQADLALGQGAELVTELQALVGQHPFRERLLAQQMLALYRAGRQAEALAAFQTGRRRLAQELGLEPGPELQALQRRILDHDPALGAPRVARAAARRMWPLSRRVLVAMTAAGLVVTGVAIGIVLGTGGTSASSADASSNRIVSLDLDSGARSGDVTLSGSPAAAASASGSIWLADPGDSVVSRIDPKSRTVVDRIPVPERPGALAAGGGSVWAASVPGDRVLRIDPASGTVTQTVPLGTARAGALAFGAGRLWIGDITANALVEVDPDRGRIRRTFELPLRPTALAVEDGALWVADYGAGTVANVDPRTGATVATVRVGNGPAALAVGLHGVWVANALDSTVSRIDPATGSVAATIPVGSGPDAVVAAGGSVWVGNEHAATVSRIDPARNVVADTEPVGGAPTAVTTARGALWVGVRPLVQHRGGTLVLLHARPISIDPALQLDLLPPVSDALTRDGLVTYNQVSGAAGIQLVPDLAVGLPAPTDGGTTYTFRLRQGIRYSDGTPLRAADFRRAIERDFRLKSDGRSLFAWIVGAAACSARACDLSRGIITDESARTVTFRLRAADGGFLDGLTVGGLATPVPPGTPFHDTRFKPIPGTGPYRIDHASEREIRYARNPYFHEWSHAARPDGNPDVIVMRFGLSPEQEVREIRAGRADWMADNVPVSFVPIMRTRYASQAHPVAAAVTDFFQFNTRLAPFDDVRVRRALNLALDRRAIVWLYGGPDFATPTCQVLPPGLSGYRPYCPYTRKQGRAGRWTAPDFARARGLVAASGTRGTPVTVWGWTDDPTITQEVVRYTARVLRRLGYPTRVHLVPHAFLAGKPPVRDTIQVIPAAWGDTAYGFFSTWFACSGPNSMFCDRRIDLEIRRAQALQATNPRAAAAIWAQVDHRLVDAAGWAPTVNEHIFDFVSARVGNYQPHPYWGLLADQLWVR